MKFKMPDPKPSIAMPDSDLKNSFWIHNTALNICKSKVIVYGTVISFGNFFYVRDSEFEAK
jgi:hypothetical protein